MISIGPHKLPNPLALAPMAGVTDLPFRALCRRQGAGLLVTEMLTSDSSLWHSRKSMQRLPHADEPGPVSVQIAGGDPKMLAQAAALNVAMGAQIIDINMGCPVKKVCRKAAGSALLRDLPLVRAILEAVVAAADVPVTLKFRTGWDADNRNAVQVAQMAQDIGIQALALHGRTRACRFNGEAEYETIAAVAKSVAIPVFANGDIDSPEKACKVLEYTGADGIMIGRAAQGNPWIFRDILSYMETGQLADAPTVADVEQVVQWHLAALHDFYGELAGVRIARKHLGWYAGNLPDGENFRRSFNTLEDAASQRHAVKKFFQQMESVTDRIRFGRYGDVSPAQGSGRKENGAIAA